MSVTAPSSRRTPSGYVEVPAFFQAGPNTLFGVLTRPTEGANGTAVTLLTGGGFFTMAHRNAFFVRLARRLASCGYHAFRFDYHGTGESTGAFDRLRMDRPFTADLEAAVAWIRSHGLERHVLVGSCFGARTALAAAPSIPGVRGLVLMAPPVRDLPWGDHRAVRGALTWKGWRRFSRLPGAASMASSPQWADRRQRALHLIRAVRDRIGRLRVSERAGREWVSPWFAGALQGVASRGVPVLLLYGNRDPMYEDLQAALPGRLGGILAGPAVHLTTIDGPVHGFETVAVQERVIEETVNWITARVG